MMKKPGGAGGHSCAGHGNGNDSVKNTEKKLKNMIF
jgi:hypothetical protein